MTVDPSAAFAAARAHMGGPFVWGRSDCCVAACAAFQALHGIDPLFGHPGWQGPVSAMRHLRRAGGYLEWVRLQFAAAGLRPVEAEPGALALIPSPGLAGAALSLCIRPGEFAGKGAAGPVFVKCDPMGAWTCRDC